MKRLLVLFVFLISSSGVSADSESVQPFAQWLSELKTEALEKGIPKDVIEDALGEAVYMERVIQSDRSQAEFKETYQDYIAKRVSEWRIENGKAYLQQHGAAMSKISSEYGVPARFIAAILGVETNYGSFTLQHKAFDVLATLSYDARRGQRFRKEIFAALTMLQNGYAAKEALKSSWAGALGVPQFMPSTYLQFAIDYDGDGMRDIWSHGPDLWASVANYLRHYGWSAEEAWARKVLVPQAKQSKFKNEGKSYVALPKRCERYKKHLKGWRKLNAWNDEGVRRMNGQALPRVDMSASIIITEPSFSHAYLVYGNFCTLMRYNPSFKYALSVGALADAIKS